MYDDLSDVIRVEIDGPIRIVRLARAEQLNAINDELHFALTRLFPMLSADTDARAAVITGEGRAFSAGGDFGPGLIAEDLPDLAPGVLQRLLLLDAAKDG